MCAKRIAIDGDAGGHLIAMVCRTVEPAWWHVDYVAGLRHEEFFAFDQIADLAFHCFKRRSVQLVYSSLVQDCFLGTS